jgi:hypothetical protein
LIAVLTIAFCSCLDGFSQAHQGPSIISKRKQPQFDLFKVNGAGLCLDKGRVQDRDYNYSETVEQIIAGGKDSIPRLIAMLTDERLSRHQIICFWGNMTVGEVAYVVLMDLFTDSTWQHATVPEATDDYFLGPNAENDAAFQRFRAYTNKHGKRPLQIKWQKVWTRYKDRLYWDDKERCFKLADTEKPTLARP